MFTFGRSSLLRQVTPGVAVRDFVVLWRENPHRWRVLAVSIALTGLMFYGFVPSNERAPPEKMQVTYISTFEAGRTEAQIIASNIANQKVKEKNEAEAAKIAEERKEFFRALGRASGLDVDALEKQYADKPAKQPAATGTPVAERD